MMGVREASMWNRCMASGALPADKALADRFDRHHVVEDVQPREGVSMVVSAGMPMGANGVGGGRDDALWVSVSRQPLSSAAHERLSGQS